MRLPSQPFSQLLLTLLATAALAASGTVVGAAPAAAVTTRESALLAKINDSRADHGLRPLALSGDLSTLARAHSRQMAAAGTMFHTSSFTSICCWSAIAENLGVGDTVRIVHRRLMASTTHRGNILDSRMRQVGVGVVSSGGTLWVTEIFRRPS